MQKIILFMLIGCMFFTDWVSMRSWGISETEPQIYFTTLASGQHVYVQEIHTQPIVTIDTWVNTGSAQETLQNNGVSHFLEHLLFKGTTKYKVGEIDSILESRGAEFNAATSKDFTHYHITTATPYFKEALNLHAEMLMNATIPEAELARERKVVQEEINRALDSPFRKAYLSLSNMLYGKHPYAFDTLGSKSNIQNIPREEILAYYHKWYQPENFKTVIAGDVDTQQTVDWVNEAFKTAYAAQERVEALQPTLYPLESLKQSKSTVLSDPNVSAIRMNIGFLAPPVTNREENYALDIAAIILGSGRSSRLYQTLKEELQLVTDIGAGNSTQQQSGVFYIDAECNPEKREAAKKAILEKIAGFKTEGPTAEELEKAKTQVIKDFAFLTESTEGVASSVGYNVTIATLEDYTNYVRNIQKISALQVQEAVRKYLDFKKAVIVEVIPESKTGPLTQQADQNIELLNKVAQSESSGSLTTKSDTDDKQTIPAVSKTVLPGGATLLLKSSPTTQTVAIAIFAKGGRLTEPKPGIAALTSQVWMKGTTSRSAKELNQELEQSGLSLSIGSDEDYLQISATSVSDDLNKLLFVLQDVFIHPTFSQEEIDKERTDMLEEIKTSRDVPSNLMFEKLTEALYPQHPYGAVGERVENSLPLIKREDLLSFYTASIKPENLVISVSGNFNADTVKAAFKQIIAEIPSSYDKPSISSYPDVLPLHENIFVDAKKAEQAASWVAYGWLAPGISRSKDYLTLKIINTLLGYGLSSRLFVDLREKQGLAYHVSSLYPSALKQSRFVMYIGTDPKNQDKVQQGFDDEIKRLQNEPVLSEELEKVKSKLIGAFALAHESNASQAFYQGLYETLGVGYQFDKEYPNLIRQVSAQDIQRVAQTYFNKPRVVTIVSPQTVRKETPTNEN